MYINYYLLRKLELLDFAPFVLYFIYSTSWSYPMGYNMNPNYPIK